MTAIGRLRNLAQRAAYTQRRSGEPAKRQWLKRHKQVTQPRRTAMRQAGQDLWDGLLGELAWQHGEARRAAELAEWNQAYELAERAEDGRYRLWAEAQDHAQLAGNPPSSRLLDARIDELAAEYPEYSSAELAQAEIDADAGAERRLFAVSAV